MNNNVLYIHTRKTDGIVFYVGIGNIKRPKSKRDRNIHWKRTVEKYGYDVKIIQKNLTWDEACILEKELIKYYGRRDKKLGTLVNQTDGGDGYKGGIPWNLGITHSNETIEKISLSLKGKLVGDNNPFYGKSHNEEAKVKMRKSAKNRPIQSEETRKKRGESLKGKKNSLGSKRSPEAIEKSKETNKRNVKVKIDEVIYRSIREASRQINVPLATLKQRCKSKNFINYQIL
jgi:group I intron endonuclease